MKTNALKTLTLFLALTSVLSALEIFPGPSVMATPSILLDPTSGHVGDIVAVTGTIGTVNGTFTIRWDQAKNLTTGKAVSTQVTTSIAIPPTNASLPGRTILVELIDNNATIDNVGSTTFTLRTEFILQVETPLPPEQLQQGATTSIRVNVTGGAPNTVYSANVTVKKPANQTNQAIVQLSNTTSTGSGGAVKTYPNDFSAHTNLTGTYFAAFNDTIAATQFSVGLTDKTVYRRNENVQIQAAGYEPSEVVTVNVETGSSSVSGFPKNFTANAGGLVTLSWKVPVNATPGTYHISFANTTSTGTVKTPSDAQDFNVTGVVCLVQAKNLAAEAVEGALIEVYNQTAPSVVLVKGNTNSTGWLRFNLDGGNYTFKGVIRNKEVGLLLNQTIRVDTQLVFPLRLVNFLTTVKTEDDVAVSLIDIALRYNFTTRDNKTATDVTNGQTNATGMATLKNLFTNTAYQVEASRYGLLFSNTSVSVESQPASPWVTLNLTLPTHELNVHALDSKNGDAAGISIHAYEWTSGVTTPLESKETSLSGDAFFSLPFGRYILRAYRGEDLLSETVLDLIKPLAFTFNLGTLNVDVAVWVFDFFGQPMANAEVRIERPTDQGFVLVSSQTTGGSGSARFVSLLGGDSRVSVYLAGKLVGVKTQFLGAGSNEVAFNVGEYVALMGYPIAASVFVLMIFIVLLIVVLLVLTRARILKVLRKQTKR
ncbi:MAG TPA: hypothetical protein VJ249_02910 [Candidatus Bathyarchaeia archaeon]|nr:hypothetical protein [Candidatus Bathyarchaeia archaeon]